MKLPSIQIFVHQNSKIFGIAAHSACIGMIQRHVFKYVLSHRPRSTTKTVGLNKRGIRHGLQAALVMEHQTRQARLMNQFPPAPTIPEPDDHSGYAHFVVVACHFEELDVLTLHASGPSADPSLSQAGPNILVLYRALKKQSHISHDQTRFTLADRNWNGNWCRSRSQPQYLWGNSHYCCTG